MRFDDRLTTALAWEPQDDAARHRLWRQLVDLTAQSPYWPSQDIDRAVARLREWGHDLPVATRRASVAALRAPRLPLALLAYLEEEPGVGAALKARTLATDSIQPSLPLAVAAVPAERSAPKSQIADLLDRIEAHRSRRDQPEAEPAEAFDFHIDRDGQLREKDGTPLAAYCAEPALGVDGQATGAWREGSAIVDARLVLEDGAHAGEWRMSAEPERDPEGRLLGYRGSAQPPRPDQSAAGSAPPARRAPPELDEAIDRLRDPLETIAEVADPAILPAGDVRVAAATVAEKSAALLAAVDALDLAIAASEDGGLDVAGLLVRIDATLQPLAEARGLKISFRVARGLPPVAADPQAVERMVTRLVGAVVALGRKGERVVTRLVRHRSDGRMLELSVTRPSRLLGRSPQSLRDPPPAASGADAPELGLGFALRLVDRLAGEAGGRLTIHDDRLVLTLPLHAEPRVIRVRGETLA